MPRHARVEGAGLIHHVTGHSSAARDAFPDDTARRGFLTLLATTAHTSGWLVLAYCLLSTHYHVLLQTVAANLGKGMHRIHGRHTQLLNARHETFGPLWRGRYHNAVVESGSHVVHAAAYIDANPIDAGMCADPGEWSWSSYRANAGLAEPWSWHRRDILYTFLGASEGDAPAVYQQAVTDAIARARERSASASP